MDIDNGELSYAYTFDISEGEASIKQLIENLKAVGYSAEEAGKMADDLAKEMTESLQKIVDSASDAGDAVKMIRDKSKELRESVKDVGDSFEGIKAEYLADSLDKVGDAIEEDSKNLDKLNDSAKGADDALSVAIVSLRALCATTQEGQSAIKAMTIAQKAFNAVLKKNPVGLVAAAIGGLVMITRKLIEATKTDQIAQKAFNAELERQLNLVQLLNSEFNTNSKLKQTQMENELRLLKEQGASLEVIRQKEDEINKEEEKRVNKNYQDKKAGIDKLPKMRKRLGELEKQIKVSEKLAKIYKVKFVEGGFLNPENGINEAMFKKYEKQSKDYQDLYKSLSTSIQTLEKAEQEKKDFDAKQSLTEEQRAKEDYDRKVKENADALALEEEKVKIMRDGYSKRINEIKAGGKAERAALEAQLNDPRSGLTEKEKENLRQRIANSQQAEATAISEVYREQNAAIIDAKKSLYDAEYKELLKKTEWGVKIRQDEIDLMEEGDARELEQMKLDHDKKLLEIEREAREEAEAYAEANKQNWLNEQRKKGRTVSESDWYASSAYKGLDNGLTEDQAGQIDEHKRQRTEQENVLNAKLQAAFLRQMLSDYGDYTAQKEEIDKRYSEARKALEAQITQDISEEDRKRISNAVNVSKKMQARDTLNLNLDTIDATAYSTVEDRMAAINKAYKEYIASLYEAGAAQAEINAGLSEQVKATGQLARLNAQIQDWENEKALALERGDIDLVEAINEVLRKLRKQLKDTQDQGDKKSIGTMIKEWADDLKSSDVIGAFGELGVTISDMAEAAGNESLANFGDTLATAGNIGARIASGDYLGAALDVITSIGNAIAEDIAKTKEFAKANEQAAVAADLLRISLTMDGDGSIFGESAVQRLANYIEALDMARMGAQRYKEEASEAADIQLGMLTVKANGKFKVNDRSRWAEFWGAEDEYMDLADFAKKNGLELYDTYGNLNADVLSLFKDTYKELSEDDRQWIDNAIAYSEQYAEAMEGIASYLSDLFGGVADTISEQLIDSFIETGEAAYDLGSIVSDVARNMSKEFVKNMLLNDVFGQYEQQFKKIMMSEGMSAEEKQKAFLALFASINDDLQEALPGIQAYLEAFNEVFGGGGAFDEHTAGNLLQSASQDSIDLVNGQMNAIRMNQLRMANAMDGILISISGLRNDVNRGFGESAVLLRDIERNTSGGRSAVNGLGLVN